MPKAITHGERVIAYLILEIRSDCSIWPYESPPAASNFPIYFGSVSSPGMPYFPYQFAPPASRFPLKGPTVSLGRAPGARIVPLMGPAICSVVSKETKSCGREQRWPRV